MCPVKLSIYTFYVKTEHNFLIYYLHYLRRFLVIKIQNNLPPVHTLPYRTPQQQMSAIFCNIRAESYPGIRCSVDQAVLDSKNHGWLPLGRVDLVLKFKDHFR